FLLTDAAIPATTLRPMLQRAVDTSFNMISIDTDTSTSDTVIVMANGMAGEVDLHAFETALNEVCIYLAKDIAGDGEGATKLIEVTVTSARDAQQAKRIAKAIVNSPLVKTAVHGADPDWGRLAMAIGKCHEETDIRPERVRMAFGDLCVFSQGEPQNADLQRLIDYLKGRDIRISIDLGIHDGQATVWGCDLTAEYVRLNAELPMLILDMLLQDSFVTKSEPFKEVQGRMLINHHLHHHFVQAFVRSLRQCFLSNDHTETAATKRRVYHDTHFPDVSRPAIE